jgi:hypothetical protein
VLIVIASYLGLTRDRASYFGVCITLLSRSLIEAVDGTPPGYDRQVGPGSGGLGTDIPKMSRSAYSNVGVGYPRRTSVSDRVS